MTTNTTPHNWPVYGHDWAVDHLRKAVQHARARHAYLLTGVDNIGKRTLAYAFAMALNAPSDDGTGNVDFEARAARNIMKGSHPDIILTERDEKTGALKIAAVRELTTKLALKPYEARYRVAIIDDFQAARGQAQDALLKTLEEPAETSVLLLIANSTDGILSTITSRCQVLNLRPLSIDGVRDVLERQYHVPPPDADLLARVSGGRVGWAIAAAAPESTMLDARAEALDVLEAALGQNRVGRFKLAEDMGRDKLAVLPILDLWLTYWRDVMLVATGAAAHLPLTNADRQDALVSLAGNLPPDAATRALHATRETHRLLERTNTNPRLALEAMFLDYPGL
ncbi:MAG: DNA polymerase III subunit delta' C-terminal domain-containing protein [Chloroflexota bacterium]